MILSCVLVSLAVLTSGSPQNRGNVIYFPGEVPEQNGEGLEEFYNNPGDKLWVPGDPDDSYNSESDSFNRNGSDFSYAYDDDSYADREPFNFVSEEDYIELPDWMDIDFNELPLDKLDLLNNATDLADLVEFFGLNIENASKLSESYNRTQPDSGSELRNAEFVETNDENAKFAKCSPEMVTVVLPVRKKASYLPSCVRLKRCGGCCNSDTLLSCQPTKVEVVSLKVLKISKAKKGRRRRRGTAGRVISMQEENHVQCSCQCKVQQKHCHFQLHNYNKDSCTCVCKNEAEQKKCEKSSSLHRWDNKSCSCMCKKERECSTGEVFSQETCRCAVGSA